MRKLFILLFISFATVVYAQESSDANTIFSRSSELKGFGAYEMKLTQISDITSLFIGASGGVTVNKIFMFGIAGYGLVSNPEIVESSTSTPLRLNGGYGGLLFGFNVFPRKVVHLSFPIVIGGGSMYLTDPFYFQDSDSEFTVEKSGFMVVEPGANLEFNVTRFFHLGMGASYRYVQGLSMNSLTDEQLLGWAINLNLKFGSF